VTHGRQQHCSCQTAHRYMLGSCHVSGSVHIASHEAQQACAGNVIVQDWLHWCYLEMQQCACNVHNAWNLLAVVLLSAAFT
jgi:hypothetical protein